MAAPASIDDMAAPLSQSAFDRPWIKLSLPTSNELGDLESLVRTDTGYAALYRLALAGGKSSPGWVFHVFTTDDGLDWTQHDLGTTSASIDYRTLSYGAGRYLVAGQSGNYEHCAMLTSSDAVIWSPQDTTLPAILQLTYLNDRFFALGLLSGIYTSRDGVQFDGGTTDSVQMNSIAYGDGTYVVAGSGPLEESTDASSWHTVSIDCSLPDACIAPPGGTPGPAYFTNIFYGAGSFYTGSFVSDDAVQWRSIDDPADVPDTYQAGWLLQLQDTQVVAWQPNGARLGTPLGADNPDQLGCRTHRCLMFPNVIVLVP